MGGCASKNKQPKEEAYKPVNPPTEQPVFEEIIPEEKQSAVATKPPMKLNGSVAEGDKRKNEYRNSLVGPGGVILPNQPTVKDEIDPTIPYIDASEDELEDEPTPSRSAKPVQPTTEVAVEPVKVSAVAAAAPQVPKPEPCIAPVTEIARLPDEPCTAVDEVPRLPDEPCTVPVPEVPRLPDEPCTVPVPEVPRLPDEPCTVLQPEVPRLPDEPCTISAADVQNIPDEPVVAEVITVTKQAKAPDLSNDVSETENLRVPTQEVGDIEEDLVNDDFSSADLLHTTGGSFVDEVLRGVAPQLMASNQSNPGPPIDVEAVTAPVEQEVRETADSALTSGKEAVEEKVEETVQNGFAAAENMVEESKEASEPVVEGFQNLNLDAATGGVIQMGGKAIVEVQSGLRLQGGDNSTDGTGFRTVRADETDCEATPGQIAGVCESVGCVYSPWGMGVGFRVGDKYIMTAYHLIRDMFDKMASQGITAPEQQILGNKDVWIQFEYLQMGEYEFDNLTRFKFASFRYSNPGLDVVIIELELHDMKPLPPPLTNFCGLGKRHRVEFAGHDGSEQKRKGSVSLILQPTEAEIQYATDWCKKQGFPPRGYEGLAETSKFRFQSAWQPSTSGSPGVVVNEDEVYIVAMLTKGYPSFILDVDEDQQDGIPDDLKLVEATSMTDVYLDMKDQANLAGLCDSVFGITVSKQS